MLSCSPVALGKQFSCGSRLAKSCLWQDLYLWHTPGLQIGLVWSLEGDLL